MSLPIKVAVVVLGLVFYFFSISSLLSSRSTPPYIQGIRPNTRCSSTPSTGMVMEYSPRNKSIVSGLVRRAIDRNSLPGSTASGHP